MPNLPLQTAVKVRDIFYGTSNCFVSYLVRKSVTSAVGTALMVFLFVAGVPILNHKTVIFCDIHGYQYECAGHPAGFFMYTLIVGK